jgi:hypothetical protein
VIVTTDSGERFTLTRTGTGWAVTDGPPAQISE